MKSKHVVNRDLPHAFKMFKFSFNNKLVNYVLT